MAKKKQNKKQKNLKLNWKQGDRVDKYLFWSEKKLMKDYTNIKK